ncbi:hypothetical protein [Nisaea sp.]
MPSPFSERMLQQVELALRSDCRCAITLDEMRSEASAAGLTGVEIEAALAQRSFDVRTSALVSLACAIKSDNAAALENARQQATALGWSDREIASFARIAKGMIDAPTPRPFSSPSNGKDGHDAAKQ